MNAACLARLRSLEAQLALSRNDDSVERERVIAALFGEIERRVDRSRPEPSAVEISAILAILDERLAALGHAWRAVT